jgi:hypothetical protein
MATASNWFSGDRRISEKLREKVCVALTETTSAFGQEYWQSWKLQIADLFVELSMGAESGQETVSDWRERIIHCGSALQSLKTSLKRQGCLGGMKLFPELDRPFLVARVYLSKEGRGHEPDPLLSDVVSPDTVFNLLSHSVAGDRCWLEMAQCDRSHERLRELAGMNEQWLFQINGERNELPDNNGQKPAGSNGWQKFFLGVKLRAPAPAPEAGIPSNAPAKSGVFGILKTKTDDKYGWIAAGQTSAQLLESARKLGVSCTFHNHALRRPSLRQELRTSIGHKGFGQAIVQLETAGQRLSTLALTERDATSPRNYSAV